MELRLSADVRAPSALGPRPRGVFTTSCTAPAAMSSAAFDEPGSPTLAVTVSTGTPFDPRNAAVPDVAAM